MATVMVTGHPEHHIGWKTNLYRHLAQASLYDQDQVGAKVDEYFVRGLASTNAAVVMRKGEWLWIGLLVFDSRDLVRMRYYTNVSTWKTRVPKTIFAWHHNIDESMPIDMMP